MPIISTTLPNDGETIDSADVNTPFNDILNVVNGNIDSDNVAVGGLNYENFGTITGEIPASDMQGSGNVEKFRDEANVAFVASGCVWSALTGLNGAMTAGVVYNANGVRNAPGAVASKTFTASRDTYVDIATNGAVSYSEVVNNDPSPALTANYVRIAKVVTNGSAITTITQSASDSLGNLIYNTKPFVDPSAWDSWTPTWTNLTVGNSTIVSKYKQIGKTVHCRVSIIFGTTGSSTASVVELTLPVAPSADYTGPTIPSGTMRQSDTGIANYTGYVRITGVKAQLIRYSVSGANLGEAVLIAMGNTDLMEFSFTYEAA